MHRFTRSLWAWLALLPCLLLSTGARSEEGERGDRSKWGFELEALHVGGGGYGGVALGYHSASYFGKSDINMGYALYAGSSSGLSSLGSHDHIYYGGVTFGAEGLLTGSLTYELNLFGGFGNLNLPSINANGEGIVLQPSAGLGMLLGYGWRMNLGAGYMVVPKVSNANGIMINLRIDRKILSSSRPSTQ